MQKRPAKLFGVKGYRLQSHGMGHLDTVRKVDHDSVTGSRREISVSCIRPWLVGFKYAYYTLIIPFYLELEFGRLKLHRSKIQNVFCTFVKILSLGFNTLAPLYTLSTFTGADSEKTLRISSAQEKVNTSVILEMKQLPKLFSFTDALSGFVHSSIFMYVMWLRQSYFLLSATDIVESHYHPQRARLRQSASLTKENHTSSQAVPLLCLLYTIKTLFAYVSCAEVFGWRLYITFYIEGGYNFYSLESIPSLSMLLHAVSHVCYLHSYNTNDLLCYLTLVMLNDFVEEFLQTLNDPSSHAKSVFKEFQHLRQQITISLNSATGLLFFISVVGSITYFSYAVMLLMQMKAFLMKLRCILNLVCSLGLLFFAARINAKMEHLQTWLHKDDNFRSLDACELSILLSEAQRCSVGVGNEIFSLNYSFLKSVIGIVVTYAVILLQFSESC